jgi:uncharacterized phage protein (TIGR01671 family)
MRPIKFRAYSKLKGAVDDVAELFWSQGGLRATGQGVYFGEGEHRDLVDDEHIILMQFTGLLDKNGKEIYGGDIVSDENFTAKIFWDTEAAKFALSVIIGGGQLSVLNLKTFEVIGNIYENPNLI